jgi:drug/metabolite transporter (DMT)-like permease
VALLEATNVSVLLLALLFLGEVGAFVDSAGDARLLSIGVASAALKAGTSLLYQRAMQLSPVSLSVPYLAFTPMLLLVTSYFLLGERPSWCGVLGVVVMTAGAYGLNGARGGDAEKTAAPSGSGSAGKGGKIKAGALPANEKVLEKAKEKASRDHLRGATARAAEDGAGGGSGGGAQKQQKPSGGGGLGGLLASPPGSGANLAALVGGDGGRKPPGGKSSGGDFVSRFACFLPAEPGSRLMLLVATLWSLTSDLDKMGKQSASSFVVFVAVQRVLMGAPLGGALVAKVGARRAGEVFVENAGLLLALAIGEMYTMAAYLMALDHLFVSYAIAAKRSGILLSVLGGAVFFKESIRDRLPYVCVILVGMVLVLLSGGDGDE